MGIFLHFDLVNPPSSTGCIICDTSKFIAVLANFNCQNSLEEAQIQIESPRKQVEAKAVGIFLMHCQQATEHEFEPWFQCKKGILPDPHLLHDAHAERECELGHAAQVVGLIVNKLRADWNATGMVVLLDFVLDIVAEHRLQFPIDAHSATVKLEGRLKCDIVKPKIAAGQAIIHSHESGKAIDVASLGIALALGPKDMFQPQIGRKLGAFADPQIYESPVANVVTRFKKRVTVQPYVIFTRKLKLVAEPYTILRPILHGCQW